MVRFDLEGALRLAVAEDAFAALVLDPDRDHRGACVLVDAGNCTLAGHHVAGPDHGRETDPQPPQTGGVLQPVGGGAGQQAKAQHSMGDHAGESDRLGDLVVLVDRVLVPTGVGVCLDPLAAYLMAEAEHRLTDDKPGARGHALPLLLGSGSTRMVARERPTSSPVSSLTTASATTNFRLRLS